MDWKNYTDSGGATYSLAHLWDTQAAYQLPPTITRKARAAIVKVSFGLHCFTRDPSLGENFSAADIYYNNPEGRLFCSDRWVCSKNLPNIVTTMLPRKCYATDRKNHVHFSNMVTPGGDEYAVFFVVTKATPGLAWNANLMILSAHERAGFRPGGKPVTFRDILQTRV